MGEIITVVIIVEPSDYEEKRKYEKMIRKEEMAIEIS